MRVTVRLHRADNGTFYDDVSLDTLDHLDKLVERAISDIKYSHLEVLGHCQDNACREVMPLGSLDLDRIRVAVDPDARKGR